MRALRVKLPFSRQIDNVSEDVSYETLQEICNELKIIPEIIPNENINFVNLEAINFNASDETLDDLDYVIFEDNGGFQYVYEYNSSPTIVSRNNPTAMQTHQFVLSNWYTFEVYMFRNNLQDENLRVYAWNAHDNRWIYDNNKTYKLYPDYLKQFYLLSPNTTIVTKNIHEKEIAEPATPDSSFSLFLWDTTMHLYNSNIRDELSEKLRVSNPSIDSALLMRWSVNWYWDQLHFDTSPTHTPYSNNTTKKDSIMIGEAHSDGISIFGTTMPKDWADTYGEMGGTHYITWDMIDELYSTEDSHGNKVWRYAIIPLATQLTANSNLNAGADSGLNQIWTEYWDNNEDNTMQLPDAANQGVIVLLPVIDKEVSFYEKEIHAGSQQAAYLADSGNIKTIRVDSLMAWQNVWKDATSNYNTSPTSIVSFMRPSQIYKNYLADSVKPGVLNWMNNYSQNGTISGAMHNIGAYGLGITNADLNNSVNVINGDDFYTAGILNYFLLDLSQATTIFTDLQLTGIKFFNDFREYLQRINGISSVSSIPQPINIAVTTENEPILKSPIYFNVRYGVEKTGSGTISADMLDWELVETSSAHVNINGIETDRILYCWDITSCANPAFDFSATMEELQFSDNRQYLNSTAWTAYQSSAYTAMASQFDTHKTQTWMNAANGMIGTGLTFLDGMNHMTRGNQLAGVATLTSPTFADRGIGIANEMKNASTGFSMAGSLAGGLIGAMNASLVSKNIDNQRAAMLAAPTASTSLPFAANVLPFTDVYFWTSYMLDPYATTLTNYHNWWGYIHYTEKFFSDLWNRIHYNYIKIDSDWNKKWITDSAINGPNRIPTTFKQLPYVELYLKRLQDGVRVHKVLNTESYYSNVYPHTIGKLWTCMDKNNLEIEFLELLNIYTLLGNYNKWYVFMYHLNGEFNEWDINVAPKPTTELYQAEVNWRIFTIQFSDDFKPTVQVAAIWVFDINTNNIYMYQQGQTLYATDKEGQHTIQSYGNWSSSFTTNSGTVWDLDSKTLTVAEPNVVVQIPYPVSNSTYTGHALITYEVSAPPIELNALKEGDLVRSISFTHDFAVVNYASGARDGQVSLSGGGYLTTEPEDARGALLVYRESSTGSWSSYTIYNDGDPAPYGWKSADGTIWDPDTRTLTFFSQQTVNDNTISSNSYTGDAYCYR